MSNLRLSLQTKLPGTTTARAVEVVEDGAHRTEDGAATVGQAREAFLRIGGSVEDMHGRIDQIAAAIDEIAASAQELVRTAEQLCDRFTTTS